MDTGVTPGVGELSELRACLDVAGILATPTVQNVSTSAVTDKWGVRWNPEWIARDVLQNFYDANRDSLSTVTIEQKGRSVVICGAAPTLLERLLYLGSEKGADDVGQCGEGFKAAALCLLRDQNVRPVVISGTRCVAVSLSDAPVRATALRPLVYTLFRHRSRGCGDVYGVAGLRARSRAGLAYRTTELLLQ